MKFDFLYAKKKSLIYKINNVADTHAFYNRNLNNEYLFFQLFCKVKMLIFIKIIYIHTNEFL